MKITIELPPWGTRPAFTCMVDDGLALCDLEQAADLVEQALRGAGFVFDGTVTITPPGDAEEAFIDYLAERGEE